MSARVLLTRRKNVHNDKIQRRPVLEVIESKAVLYREVLVGTYTRQDKRHLVSAYDKISSLPDIKKATKKFLKRARSERVTI